MFRNRSERQRLEKLLEDNDFLDHIFHCIQDGILLTDPDGKITFINPPAEEILGIPKEQLLGAPVAEIPVAMHTREGDRLTAESKPFTQVMNSKASAAQQVILKRPDGSTFPVMFNIGRAEDGQMVAILTDLSELFRKQRQMEEYFRLVAHDLRAPLTAAVGHSELLEKEILSEEEKKVSYRAIRTSTEHMLDLVEAITDRMRIENDNFLLVKSDFDLAALTRTLASQLAVGQRYHPLTVDLPPELVVHADLKLIRRAIANLISNAIKFSSQNLEIHICARANDKGTVLTVSDHGIGIDAHDLPFLFEPYFISEAGKARSGVGLGLYITHKVVKAHGGNLFVCSEKGEGSTFALFLPHRD